MPQSEFVRVIRRKEVIALAFGAMIGWSWVALSGAWIAEAGSAGAILAFALGGIAIILVAAAAILVTAFLKYRRVSSEKRMLAMMERMGLDPELARYGDNDSVIQAVRGQCRKCQSEALCDRWLAGEESGDNDFCPNAQIFSYLKSRVRAVPPGAQAAAQ